MRSLNKYVLVIAKTRFIVKAVNVINEDGIFTELNEIKRCPNVKTSGRLDEIAEERPRYTL